MKGRSSNARRLAAARHDQRDEPPAQAERERRAKVIHAEGEFEASRRLAEAGAVMAAEPTPSSSATCKRSLRSPPKQQHRRLPNPGGYDSMFLRASGVAMDAAAAAAPTRRGNSTRDATVQLTSRRGATCSGLPSCSIARGG